MRYFYFAGSIEGNKINLTEFESNKGTAKLASLVFDSKQLQSPRINEQSEFLHISIASQYQFH